MGSQAVKFPNKWAFLVGAAQYKRVEKLKCAANDALEMQKAFHENLDFPEKNIVTLSDLSTLKPERSEIFEQLGRLIDIGIGQDDLLLFYFSGHGYYDLETKDDYLLPIEASTRDMENTAIRVKVVVDKLQRTACKNIVMFIDACREGVEDSKSLEGLGRASESTVNREGLATFFSCDPRERSFEIPDLGHGSFTYCLLDAIRKPQIETVSHLETYLSTEVPLTNAKYQRRPQKPFLILNPQDIKELKIFASRVIAATAGADTDLIDKLTDLFNALRIEAQYFADALELLEQKRETKWDQAKLQLLKELCAGKLPPDKFMTAWARLDKQRAVPSSEPSRILPPSAFTSKPEAPTEKRDSKDVS